MAGRKRRAENGERFTVTLLGLAVFVQIVVDDTKVGQALGDVWMAGWKRLAANVERFHMTPRRGSIFAQGLLDHTQVVQAFGDVGMPGPEHLAAQSQCLPMALVGMGELA